VKRLEVRSKVWLEVDGEPLLGEGRERLLRFIDQEGSISAAARAMAIPYRKAWSYLENMEQKLGFALVERSRAARGSGRRSPPRPARCWRATTS
jgi:molybdate transport system regulatory protein